MFKDYARLTVFFCCVLIGVQIPGVLKFYQQRVEAHLSEAQQALGGFEQTAQRHFDGDIQALVAHYRRSPDPVFQQDADSVAAIVERVDLLRQEWDAMQGGQIAQLWHFLGFADTRLREETLDSYRYQVLLTPTAIGWGLAVALILSVLAELLVKLVMPKRRSRRFA
ncbi:conserved hypothetical protein [Ferrimonas balearica DSM 9799]|uniref:DUF2937 domain-containing protein n=1 Tax=Ferrimonas balearica (strain DSM 9799 / CCM 4581 / KCTC 23876 / PAT) TaxID=550540 RepID=E1SV82_FERBD|nr:DUF2937 family protein [Ferrimonas balearica]ADN77382.1 conserved hypothetical protein [Ferrimonas balearica DSM 9799]MBW3164655.1 DUF2937 family protein [Ferrimonas balearica]MBY5980484.1 DUF2937 family protein [Ferrimonas balearica]